MRKRIRLISISAACVLLLIEMMIGLYAGGWVRSYLGDVLVVPLIYAIIRAISPIKPKLGFILPTIVLVFACIVELMQLIGIADILGITDPLLRTVIGTSFSVIDIICYAIGAVPLYIIETILTPKNIH